MQFEHKNTIDIIIMENNSSHDEYEDNEQLESQDETDSEELVGQHPNLVFLSKFIIYFSR